MIKVITFDLDDTLWDIGTVITKANTLMLAWMQQHAPKFSQTYDHHGIDALRDEIWQQQPQLKHDLSQSRIALIQLGLERCGYRSAANLAQAAFEVYFSARNDVLLFDGAQQQLQALGKHYTVGALTNGNADLQRVGLDHLFDFYLNSAQVGVSKPHPKFFEAALRHTGVPPQAFIHIGDHPQHDIAGAQAAGMHSIWMNPNNALWPAGQASASQEIQNLHQLSDAVAKIHDH